VHGVAAAGGGGSLCGAELPRRRRGCVPAEWRSLGGVAAAAHDGGGPASGGGAAADFGSLTASNF